MAQKSEEPTRRKLDDARKKGQVAHSREVDSAVVMLVSFGVLRFGGAAMWNSMEALLRGSFAALDRNQLTTELTSSVGTALVGQALLMLAPLLAAILGFSLLAGFVQTGGILFATSAVMPKMNRLSPMAGAKRLFMSKQAYVQLVKSLLKFIVLGGVAALAVKGRWEDLAALGTGYSLPDSIGVIVDIAFSVTLKVTLVVLGMAIADFLFQKYDLMGQLRMTRQEVKDELRQSEGDPAVKAQMARMRRSFLTRVMQAVPKADVILVNPTHYAVALKYDPATSVAPIVIAKGAGLMAQRIREIATENRIPIITNPPLTRAIYKAVAIGREITPELYEAVAEILAFVYRLRTSRVASRV
jgi:flagellar biosynthetic protein FlhB